MLHLGQLVHCVFKVKQANWVKKAQLSNTEQAMWITDNLH